MEIKLDELKTQKTKLEQEISLLENIKTSQNNKPQSFYLSVGIDNRNLITFNN